MQIHNTLPCPLCKSQPIMYDHHDGNQLICMSCLTSTMPVISAFDVDAIAVMKKWNNKVEEYLKANCSY